MAKKPDLKSFSDDELLDLSHEIMGLLLARQRRDQRQELLAFDRGARVSFKGPDGNSISGMIVRVNQKTLTIATERGTWRIDPCFVVMPKGSSGKSIKS